MGFTCRFPDWGMGWEGFGGCGAGEEIDLPGVTLSRLGKISIGGNSRAEIPSLVIFKGEWGNRLVLCFFFSFSSLRLTEKSCVRADGKASGLGFFQMAAFRSLHVSCGWV